MENEEKEDTQENPAEEETAEEEPQEEVEEKETPKEEPKDQYTDREKRYYARMKKAEEAASKAKKETELAKREAAKAKMPISDIDAILEVQSSTKDLDTEEIAELKLRATALGISLTDARKNENYLVWQTGYREKVAKENAAKPSTTQPGEEKPKTLADELKSASAPGIREDVRKLKEKEEILAKAGLWKSPSKRADEFKLS